MKRVHFDRLFHTVPVLCAMIAVLCVMTTIACEAEPAAPSGPSITIRNNRVTLEITSTPAAQIKGLGQRDSLAWGHGMLFEYAAPRFPGFWMKDMRFDIDIIWLREGRIVDISHRVPHSKDGPGPTIRPSELTDTVLEVPIGFAQANGWRVGDRAVLDRADAPPLAP